MVMNRMLTAGQVQGLDPEFTSLIDPIPFRIRVCAFFCEVFHEGGRIVDVSGM
jgi:hypothetical protein